MGAKYIPKNIKVGGILLIFMMIISYMVFSFYYHIDNLEFQKKMFQYFWGLTLYSCFFNTFIRRDKIPKVKSLLIYLITMLGIVILFNFSFLLNTFSITTIILIITFYNILFLTILYELSKLNLFGVMIALLNIIVFVGLFGSVAFIHNFYFMTYSTSLTYIISLIFIIYIFINLKFSIFKSENLYKFFIVFGNLITIILYFILMICYINNYITFSASFILYVCILQPIFYWIGVNFILMED